jgi:hypothetical protein
VRVKMLVRGDMAQLEAHPWCHMCQGGWFKQRILRCSIDDYPVIILVSMRVKGNLLFYRRGSEPQTARENIPNSYVYCHQGNYGGGSANSRPGC